MKVRTKRSNVRLTSRIERHYTLPLGNIRVYDHGVRELFTEIEDLLEKNIGIRPARTDVLLAALRAYHHALKKRP